MPVTEKQPPVEVQEVIQSALRQSAGVPDAEQHTFRGIEVGALQPEAPHEVFNLGLSELKTGPLTGARKVGWRYLLREKGQIVATAEAVIDGSRGVQFSHFNRGPFVQSTAAALDSGDETVDRDISFEPRLLHIPAIYAMIMWFHTEGGKDVYVPLAPAPEGIEAGRRYSEAELMPLLRSRAASIPDLAPDDTRGG